MHMEDGVYSFMNFLFDVYYKRRNLMFLGKLLLDQQVLFNKIRYETLASYIIGKLNETYLKLKFD